MYVALDENNNYIDIDDALSNRKAIYYCPQCHGQLRIKNGNINSSHFAHVSIEDCDSFSSDMSEWHRAWQKEFSIENREVVIQGEFHPACGIKNNKITHRADICMNGYVIEFQHSKISQTEFDERNSFYMAAGYKVVWIFDFIDEYKSGKLNCYSEWHKATGDGGKYAWTHPCKFMCNWNPKNDRNIIVFFQIADCFDITDVDACYLERVTWVVDDYGCSNFKRFFTTYLPGNIIEIKQLISDKKL